MKEHTRNYQYRPPLNSEIFNSPGAHSADWGLIWSFAKRYAWRFRVSLIACVLLVMLNSNYSYVISYLTSLVVDDVLVVSREVSPSEPQKGPVDKEHVQMQTVRRPAQSLGRQMSIARRLTPRPIEANRKLWTLAAIYMMALICFNMLGRWAARRQIVVGQNIMGELREDMHKKILSMSLSYHHFMSPGRLLSRIISDVSAVQTELMNLVVTGVSAVTQVIVGLTIMVVCEYRVIALLAIFTPLYLYFLKKQRPVIRKLQAEQRHTNSCLYNLASQKIDAVKAIQSYAQEGNEAIIFHRLSSCFTRDAVVVEGIALGLSFKTVVISQGCNCLIMLLGGLLVLKGEMTLGKLLFLQTTAMMMFTPVSQLSLLSFTMQRLNVALKRCTKILEAKEEIVEKNNAVEFPVPLQNGIAVEHLWFRYPAEPGQPPNDFVLKNLSMRIQKGEWLCVMGASGCGKSTLLMVLARLYEPAWGRIFYDATPLEKISFSSLRQNLGVVPQEAQIFSGTVRDNIAFGLPKATNTQILAATQAAQLHEFVMEMPVKYETIIGQKGQSLSGGQRQRLSLARALLTNPEVMLLDDCTSALDATTERKIQETLTKQLDGKTAVIVSQRVSMAARCHHIAVISNGVISEYGTHQELLKKNGFYATLYREQTGK